MIKKCCLAIVVASCSIASHAELTVTEKVLSLSRPAACEVSKEIERNDLPPTPQNMSLPAYGQGIIGWGTGADGALKKLQTVNVADVKVYQQKGVTLAMVQEWQRFYENETQRNSCNPTAPIRAALMATIAHLWIFA